MAHKKGVGSSKNGRESASQRLGVKIWGGQKCIRSASPATSLFASVVPSITLARTLVLAKTTRFMRWLTVWLTSTKVAVTRALCR